MRAEGASGAGLPRSTYIIESRALPKRLTSHLEKKDASNCKLKLPGQGRLTVLHFEIKKTAGCRGGTRLNKATYLGRVM